MAIFKCKICGGTLDINVDETVATCEYCGTKQTLPKLDDEKKANLFDRANHFRRNNDFDKAMGIYEQILNEDTEDAESYWSIVLCRYGIEYVEDPSTHKRVPTVNRAQFTSVFDDEDYKSAIKYADNYQKDIYEQEARTINEIQKGILAISGQEEPFDVFICYKESDNSGRRTPDSVLATELYHELTREGFKVFFSRITLEDKLGVAYEPYIFAALHSAKVMVALGTKPEHFNAVWVKNEWSRYLSLIKSGANKILIPAYRDMDPYDLPEEFSHLQAQDMSKLGFMQDLVRGIKKLLPLTNKGVKYINANYNVSVLLEKAFLLLEDGKWKNADKYLSQILDIEPKNAKAYLGKLMIDLKIKSKEDLVCSKKIFKNNPYYLKAIRFGDSKLISQLEYAKNENIYLHAERIINSKKIFSYKKYKKITEELHSIIGYKNSEQIIDICKDREARVKKKKKKRLILILGLVITAISATQITNKYIIPNNKYKKAMALYSEKRYEEAESLFNEIPQFKNSDEYSDKCVNNMVSESTAIEFLHKQNERISYKEFVKLYGNLSKEEIRYGKEYVYPQGVDSSSFDFFDKAVYAIDEIQKIQTVNFWGVENIPKEKINLLGQQAYIGGCFGGWFEPLVSIKESALLGNLYFRIEKEISKNLFEELVSYISTYEGNHTDIEYTSDKYTTKWISKQYEYTLTYTIKENQLQYSKDFK